ncbi:MAG TPA: adenylate/guanylate cyclase domain-containing protein [Gaiellaceae bacterium]|nr:adenylate/guanylate cyclase domain-containing protein [Gaiellaceae bacterium]
MVEQPMGTITMLFTDIEGSTRLLDALGVENYGVALGRHQSILRGAFLRHGGYEVDSEGDSFFVAFSRADEALAAATEAQAALTSAAWPGGAEIRVRMGLHTGEPHAFPPKYVGLDVHRAARIMAAAHGGQVVVSATTHDLLDEGNGLKDLGEHRLKDLSVPMRLYQVGDFEFPPLKALFDVSLPVQLTPLVGRVREIRAIEDRLREGARLVTLTGPGGIGKTRLALQVAAESSGLFPGGVWFVPLADVAGPELVAESISAAIGVHGSPAAWLAREPSLLVLDNFEHVLSAAGVVSDLLARAGGLHIIATSRARLGLQGEHEFVVDPLPANDGIELFTTRARQLVRDFEPDEHVGQVVARVDGLPLAIELAAARVKLLPPAEIAARVGASIDLLRGSHSDAPARQRTLRATLEWSYALLGEHDREIFARLGVFDGRVGLEDVEEVVGASLDDLASLVDKSLVRPTADGRFFMLRTIRALAVELFVEREDAEALRSAHAQWMLRLIGTGWPALDPVSPNEPKLKRLIGLEPNLRLALEWLAAHDPSAFGQAAARLFGFWHVAGLHREGFRWVRQALDSTEPTVALLAAGSYLSPEDAHEFAKRQLALAQELQDAAGEANAYRALGIVHTAAGEFDRAEACAARGCAIAAAHGLEWERLTCLGNVADAALHRGQWQRVAELLAPEIATMESLGHLETLLINTYNLAQAELRIGRIGVARARVAVLVERTAAIDFEEMKALALLVSAESAAAMGDTVSAARFGAAAAATFEAVDGWVPPFERNQLDRIARDAACTLGEERARELEREGRALSTADALEEARAVLADAAAAPD